MFRKRPRVWAVTSSSSGELPSRVAMKRSWRQINRRQKLDEQLPTLTVNFVAPTPSNPANAAQPAPASAQAAPKKKK